MGVRPRFECSVTADADMIDDGSGNLAYFGEIAQVLKTFEQ
jgi:hypothetical protein